MQLSLSAVKLIKAKVTDAGKCLSTLEAVEMKITAFCLSELSLRGSVAEKLAQEASFCDCLCIAGYVSSRTADCTMQLPS